MKRNKSILYKGPSSVSTPYEIKCKVRFGDVDMMGHVNNIIAHAEIDFRSPVGWNDELLIRIRPSSVGTKSWTYEYEILNTKDGNRLVAEGKTVQVAYDYKSGSSITLPENAKEVNKTADRGNERVDFALSKRLL